MSKDRFGDVVGYTIVALALVYWLVQMARAGWLW
jgi:hypothetical protein